MEQTVSKIDAKKQFKVNITPRIDDTTLVARLKGINKLETTPELADLANWYLNLAD
jgi:hypothetical protein